MFDRKKFLSLFVLLYFWLNLISSGLGKLERDDPEVCLNVSEQVDNAQRTRCSYGSNFNGRYQEECLKDWDLKVLKCCEPGFKEVSNKCKRKFDSGLLKCLIAYFLQFRNITSCY